MEPSLEVGSKVQPIVEVGVRDRVSSAGPLVDRLPVLLDNFIARGDRQLLKWY